MLKDYLGTDMATFFNTGEFANKHTINGIEMDIVVDEEMLAERTSQQQGIYLGDVLFYVPKAVLGGRPVIGKVMNFDGKIYRIADVQEDAQVYTITIEANKS